MFLHGVLVDSEGITGLPLNLGMELDGEDADGEQAEAETHAQGDDGSGVPLSAVQRTEVTLVTRDNRVGHWGSG